MGKTTAWMVVAACVAAGLSACASDPKSSAGGVPSLAAAEPVNYTGSRLKKPTTEQIVRAVGNKDYQEDRLVKSLGNDIANLPPKK